MSRGQLVSAVIPVRDGARFLRQAIESVLGQEYAPVELVVVDDGSTDDSAAIAASYAEVCLIRTGDGGGVSRARNAGVDASGGTLLAFLDQDDVWTPGRLETQVAALMADESLGYVLGRQRIFVEPGTREPSWLRRSGLEREHVAYFPSALVVRREVFDRVGPFREDAPPAEGADWFLRANEAGIKRGVVQEVVLLKRVHEDNQSGDMTAVRTEVLRNIKYSLDRRRTAQR